MTRSREIVLIGIAACAVLALLVILLAGVIKGGVGRGEHNDGEEVAEVFVDPSRPFAEKGLVA